MRCRGVLLVGRAVADVAVEDQERRAPLRLPEDLERVLDPLDVVRVAHPEDVPPVGEKARRDVLGERDPRRPLDRDVVVVVDPAEVVEAEVAREGGRLGRDPFHHAAVSGDGEDAVVEDVEAGTVVTGGEPLLADRHPDAGRDALPERTGGAFDAGDPAVFGVARRLAVELAESADVVERHGRLPEPLVLGVHGLDARQVEDRPEEHRGVPVRQDEPVAVRPDRVFRVEVHHPVPERVDERREGHRRSGMAGLRLLDRVDRQGADRVDRQLLEVRGAHVACLPRPSGSASVSRAATLPRRRRCRSSWL